MAVTVTDEVFDENGLVVATRLRTVVEPMFTRTQYLAARRQVRQVMNDANTPQWGKALARYLLMQEYMESEDDPINGV